MKKQLLQIALMLTLVTTVGAGNTGIVPHTITASDDWGEVNLTSVEIYLPGTSTYATIYKDAAGTLPITQPITSGSTNTTLTGGTFSWFGPDGFDYKLQTTYLTQTNWDSASLDASTAFIRMQRSLALDHELYALSALSPSTGSVPYWSSSTVAAVAPSTSFGRSLWDDADAAAARTTLELVLGTHVQAWDTDLDSLAAGITGMVKGAGNGKQYSAAADGTDYLAPTRIDDTKGNGDTAYLWSADKVIDQLALKQAADADLDTWATIAPDANWIPMLKGENTATDAQRRTWKADVRLDLVVDVRDFGAIPDDGVDDWAAIEAAYAAMPSGGTLYFYPGVYESSDTIRFGRWSVSEANEVLGFAANKQSFTIRGGGDIKTGDANGPTGARIVWTGGEQIGDTLTTYTNPSGTYDVFSNAKPLAYFLGCTGVTLENLVWDANDGNGAAYSAVEFDGNHDLITLRNCEFTDGYYFGLRNTTRFRPDTWATYYGYAADANFIASTGIDVAAQGGWQGNSYTAINCEFTGNAIGFSCESQQSLGMTFIGCSFSGNTTCNIHNSGGRIDSYGCWFGGTPTNTILHVTSTCWMSFYECHDESDPTNAFFSGSTTPGANPILSFVHSDFNDIFISSGGANISFLNCAGQDGGVYRLVDADQEFYLDVRNSSVYTVSLADTSYASKIHVTGANVKATGGGALLTGAGAAKCQHHIANVYPRTAYTVATMVNPLAVGNGATGAGYIDLLEDSDDGAHYLRQQTAALAGNVTLTWPTDDGEPNEVLQTNGSGVLDWKPIGYEDVNNIGADITNFDTHGLQIVSSNTAEISGALADGTVLGQRVKFVCKIAGNNIIISVAHHVTSDPEVIVLDTAKEWVELVWDGTDWVECGGNGQSYP